MYLEIITPEQKVFEGTVEAATFPGAKGSFQVLNNHAPIISTLTKGTLEYKEKRERDGEQMMIEGGVVEVNRNRITVLVEKILN